jgi:hypothetical protein
MLKPGRAILLASVKRDQSISPKPRLTSIPILELTKLNFELVCAFLKSGALLCQPRVKRLSQVGQRLFGAIELAIRFVLE